MRPGDYVSFRFQISHKKIPDRDFASLHYFLIVIEDISVFIDHEAKEIMYLVASVGPSVCPSVCPSVSTLTAEPFDL